jgi:hypothetical protein
MPSAYRAVAGALARASRESLRIVHFSVQTDHVHMIIEADGKRALSRGMRGVAIRIALAVNRALGRHGAVWSDRYHARALNGPRLVRNALVYVLAIARMHFRKFAGLDPCSSALWFDGYREANVHASQPAPTHAPRTWLLRVGWRRGGLLSLEDAPRQRGRSSPSPRGGGLRVSRMASALGN